MNAKPKQSGRKRPLAALQADQLSVVAAWQFAVFFLLFLLVWANEVLDLTHPIFDTPPSPTDYLGGFILSIFVVLVAVINVGHTYLQQRHIITGLITMCSHCHKVRVNQDVWDGMEKYVTEHSRATISHGLCPICYEREMDDLRAQQPLVNPSPGRGEERPST